MNNWDGLFGKQFGAISELQNTLKASMIQFPEPASLTAAMGVLENSQIASSLIDFRRQTELFNSISGRNLWAADREMRHLFDGQHRIREALGRHSYFDEAQRAAEAAQLFHLPDILAPYRSTTEELALGLSRTFAVDLWREPAYLETFNKASALAHLYDDSTSVSQLLTEANRSMLLDPIGIASLADYRSLLDAAGLRLPRWPRVRRLSTAERRKRFRERMKENVEPPHVRKAKSLVHQYESVLREVLTILMEGEYGEDWAEARLDACGCKDLLGRWKKRGGEVLDHADYAHYERIISNSEHFETVFYQGFDDAETASELIGKAGNLRAASHHARVFTTEDLRDLRIVWRTISTALVALEAGYEFEF